MLTLTELAQKYDVDKLELGYISFYEQRFEPIRNSVTKFLEIGIERGNSHRMWLEYFPNATIYGFDIFNEDDRSGYVSIFRESMKDSPFLDRSVTFKGDQSNVQNLNSFIWGYGGNFDIIIDDGGHSMKMQQVSLDILYNKVNPGGYYVIEDMHTSSGQWKNLYGFDMILPNDTLTTDLMLSIENRDDEVLETNYISKDRLDLIRGTTESCKTEYGNHNYRNYIWPCSLAFMKKVNDE